jgi:DNA-binding MarR family transcriptional regulator/GNAT superfamily N-acetyltransferase
MERGKSSLVSEIRSASRDLVREFGFMNRTVAGTDLSVSAVHAIIEIGKADGLSSKDLSDRLILEKSTVSRLVKSLVDRKEIHEVRSKDDARMKYLHLTSRGRATLNIIDNYAEAQVSAALGQLDQPSRQGVLAGLQNYAAALKAASGAQSHARPPGRVVIKTGYATSIIGRIVELLGSYMTMRMGFGAAFEARIAADIAEFMARVDAPSNETWRAEIDGKILGSISIDGEDLGDGLAHLRWFIVGDEIRGGGVGGALLARALDFCDEHGYRETQLWTVKGLDAARRLYEKNGFVLADEYTGDQWGTDVVEQMFVRPNPH